jgi:hypothetical protein
MFNSLVSGSMIKHAADAGVDLGVLEDEDIAGDEVAEQGQSFFGKGIVAAAGTGVGVTQLAPDEADILEAVEGSVDAVIVGGDGLLADGMDNRTHLVGIGGTLVEEKEHPEGEKAFFVGLFPSVKKIGGFH